MLGLGARCTGGCTPPLPRGAADGGLSGWATTPCWRSTHGFPHSSKCSGRIRPGPMREKTEYRDELLEHAFMGCLRAGLRSLPEGQELGGEEEKKAVCEVLAHAAARGRP